MICENDLISVIVPVYKVEQYLEKCIKSIVSQTYENIEIILIDDGSPDKCPQICEDWSEKDKRITVIHRENGGLSAARNSGLDIFKGKYVCFIDSDDFIHHEYISSLYKLIKEYNADISKCNHKEFRCENQLYLESKEEIQLIDCQKELLENPFLPSTVWIHLYDRYIFDKIRFPEGKKCEDIAVSYKIFEVAKKLVKTNKILYFYRQRSDSIMGAKTIDTTLDLLSILEENYLYFLSKNLVISNNILLFYVYTIPSIYTKHNRKEISKDLHKSLKMNYITNLWRLKQYGKISTKSYIKHRLYSLNLFLYGDIKKCFRYCNRSSQ